MFQEFYVKLVIMKRSNVTIQYCGCEMAQKFWDFKQIFLADVN